MPTETQYPLKHMKNADEYGKNMCKLKYENGSMYLSMLQSAQLSRAAVVIEHSTVTDMPIAQYGLCKSPTVTFSLLISDNVPYKIDGLKMDVTTPKAAVDKLNYLYENHKPFSITIPQAFTDYLHDLVITSLTFQVSADRRYVIQADVAATSVNVIKLGYQQGAVKTEASAKTGGEKDLLISDLSNDDPSIDKLRDTLAKNDKATGIVSYIPYREELYNSLTDGALSYLPQFAIMKKASNTVFGEGSYENTLADAFGLANMTVMVEQIEEGNIGAESSMHTNTDESLNIYRKNKMLSDEKVVTQRFRTTSPTKDENGNIVENGTYTDITLDYTNVNSKTIHPNIDAAVSVGKQVGFVPALLSPQDDKEYMTNIAMNVGKPEWDGKTPYEFAEYVDRKMENKANVFNVDAVLNDKKGSYEIYSATGKAPGELTKEQIIEYYWQEECIPVDKKGNILINDYSKAKRIGTANDENGKELGRSESNITSRESTQTSVQPYTKKVHTANGDRDINISDSSLMTYVDDKGQTQLILTGKDILDAQQASVGRINT